MDSFYILSMRSINFATNLDQWGDEEMEEILQHYGEVKVHKGVTSQPVVNKEETRKEWIQTKRIVKGLKYDVDNMAELWCILTKHHSQDIPNVIKLAQLALALPLHTADSERTFLAQNLILTKQRNRLGVQISDRLLRVKIEGRKNKLDMLGALSKWRISKKRLLKSK